MIALRERFVEGVEAALAEHGMPWSIVSLGARWSTASPPEPPRTGAESAAAGDAELEEYLHLYLMNRGVLITPFHNMALMCPATTEEQVDRHTEVFTAAVPSCARELLRAHRGAAARGRVARASRAASSRSRGVRPRDDADPAARPGGEAGVGEDVVYDELDHVNLQADGPKAIDLAGSYTLDSFSQRLEETELFPAPPVRDAVARLPALGVRVGGARPRAAPGRPLARRTCWSASRGR